MDSTYIADRLRTMVVVGLGIIGLLVGTSTVAVGVPEGAAFGLGIGLLFLGTVIGLRIVRMVPELPRLQQKESSDERAVEQVIRRTSK